MLTATEAKDLFTNEAYNELLLNAEEAIRLAAPSGSSVSVTTTHTVHAPRLSYELIKNGYNVSLSMTNGVATIDINWR